MEQWVKRSVPVLTLTSAIGFALMGTGPQSSSNVHAADFKADV
jgi:hypothetical protein